MRRTQPNTSEAINGRHNERQSSITPVVESTQLELEAMRAASGDAREAEKNGRCTELPEISSCRVLNNDG